MRAPRAFQLRPSRVPIHRPEQALQRAVGAFLDVALVRAAALWFAVPNGGLRSKVEAAIMKALGVKAGVADICVVWNDGTRRARVGFIELQAADGTLSDAQIAFGTACDAIGAPVALARSVDEVETALRAWGVPLRARKGIEVAP